MKIKHNIMNKIQKFKSFWFNGEKYLSSNHKLSIYDLINYFNYNPSLLVVEYNKFIVVKKNWKKIVIKDNDKIEILTIVGGG
uniref:Thiamine biosynthesis protein S n=1 Tax=Rhizosolenia fallax TaxID=265545 RepID=A0A2U9NRE5_9STRA|nr:thiamine biosynthesis protein S [Rhizosolenia fallax]AWT39701.1 thiamine biosynthesis protein S [Rhizosolenia fallax]